MKYEELDKGQTYGDMVVLGRFSYMPIENIVISSTSILGYIYFKDTRLYDAFYNKLCKHADYRFYLLCTEKTLTSQNIYIISKDFTYKSYCNDFSSSYKLGRRGKDIDIKSINTYLCKLELMNKQKIFGASYKGYTLKEIKDSMYNIVSSKEYQKVYKQFLDGIKWIFIESFVKDKKSQEIMLKDLDYNNSMLFDNVSCALVKTKKGFGFLKESIGDFLFEDYKLQPNIIQNHKVLGDNVYFDISNVNDESLLKNIKSIKDTNDVLSLWNSYLYAIVYQGESLC